MEIIAPCVNNQQKCCLGGVVSHLLSLLAQCQNGKQQLHCDVTGLCCSVCECVHACVFVRACACIDSTVGWEAAHPAVTLMGTWGTKLLSMFANGLVQVGLWVPTPSL